MIGLFSDFPLGLSALANSSSEALNILLLLSHLKETTIFLLLSFPCSHSRTKLRPQELHLFLCRCHATTWSPDLTHNRLYCNFRIDTCNGYAMDFFWNAESGKEKIGGVMQANMVCVICHFHRHEREMHPSVPHSHGFWNTITQFIQPKQFYVEILFHSCVNLMITPFFLSRFYLDLHKVIWRGKEGQLYCYL